MRTDVLIVGAGPSGLTLANVLAECGIDFRIMDKKSRPVEQSRAALVHVRTLELWDKLGLAERAVQRGLKTTRVEVYERGRCASEFPLAGRGAESLTPFPYALTLPQSEIEQLLVEGLKERGARVEWNTEVLGAEDAKDGARSVVRHEDGTEDRVEARWVVGADGASSVVRHSLGLGFGGETYEQTGLLADVEMDTELDPGKLRLNLTRDGFVGIGALPGGLYRLFGAVPPNFAARDISGRVSHEAYGEVGLEDLQKWFDEYFFVDARLRRGVGLALPDTQPDLRAFPRRQHLFDRRRRPHPQPGRRTGDEPRSGRRLQSGLEAGARGYGAGVSQAARLIRGRALPGCQDRAAVHGSRLCAGGHQESPRRVGEGKRRDPTRWPADAPERGTQPRL